MSLEENLRLLTKAAGVSMQVLPSVASGDYAFAEPIIKEQGITDLIICGGDGTINQVVQGLRHLNLPFGIIPSGSGNGLAFSAGIPKNLQKAVGIILNGKAKDTDAFSINNQFACMLCGFGLDAQVAHDFANAPTRGLMTYVQKTLSCFMSAPAYKFRFSTQGRDFTTAAFFISIANSNQFGNNFRIAPKASLTDGLLDIVIMTRQNKMSVLLQTIRQISGYHALRSVEMVNEHASLIYFQTDQIEIENVDGAPMHIDGDPVHAATRASIEVIPAAFRLLSP